jgi:hypothetical protein
MTISVDLELPPAETTPAFTRADLTFYGLDHSGPSYETRVFFDTPDATADSPLEAAAGYVGSFAVFGHGGCFGEHGHCQVRGPVTSFDRRLPHQLVPATRVLLCTDAIRGRLDAARGQVTVTIVPVIRHSPLADAEQAADVLHLDQIALHTYE